MYVVSCSSEYVSSCWSLNVVAVRDNVLNGTGIEVPPSPVLEVGLELKDRDDGGPKEPSWLYPVPGLDPNVSLEIGPEWLSDRDLVEFIELEVGRNELVVFS